MDLKLKALSLVAFFVVSSCFTQASAQQVAVKTNLLYDATTTPNIGMEIGVGKKHSLQLFYGLNPWKFDTDDGEKYLKHWMLSPEYRYWLCHRFQGSFFGIHALGGEFDAANIKLPFGIHKGLREHRDEGWYVGGGVTYGYQWVLSRHWNFEASLGVGVVYAKFKEFECGQCGREIGDGDNLYIGPTKAALSLLYMF